MRAAVKLSWSKNVDRVEESRRAWYLSTVHHLPRAMDGSFFGWIMDIGNLDG